MEEKQWVPEESDDDDDSFDPWLQLLRHEEEPRNHESEKEKEREDSNKDEEEVIWGKDNESEDEEDPTFQPEEGAATSAPPVEDGEVLFMANQEEQRPRKVDAVALAEKDWYDNITQHCRSVSDFHSGHPFLDQPFVPEHFLHWFVRYSKEARQSGNKRAVHAVLVSIMLSTLKACREGRYTPSYGSKDDVLLNADELRRWAQRSRFYRNDTNFSFKPNMPLYPATVVEVWQKDTAEAGREMMLQNLHPAVLNLASRTSPGGGFQLGHWAQEECLTRRSNYYQVSMNLSLKCWVCSSLTRLLISLMTKKLQPGIKGIIIVVALFGYPLLFLHALGF